MTHLLHLDASARSDSLAGQLGATFARRRQDTHRVDAYTYRDLSTITVRPIDEALVLPVTRSPARIPGP
ncbi:hypothetical protein [Streptomyces sp. NPDC005953]|uniref:hypothetical protein n=1 Tax=Streptomyces sp. NPDC005953 TaxID=3156719 RepID=UPI0034097C8B